MPTFDERYHSTHILHDGTKVVLRLIGPQDRERLAQGFEKLSPESRYRRFLTPTPRLSAEALRVLTETDGWNHLAIGAAAVDEHGAEGEGFGVARFIRLPESPEIAEASVAVIDERQGLGLGDVLLGTLVEAARERGIRTFRGYVLRENEPMRALFDQLTDQAEVTEEEDFLVYDVPLPPASAVEPKGSALYRLLKLAAGGIHFVSRRLYPPKR